MRGIERAIEAASQFKPKACAVGLAESPVRLDLKTSKRNTCAAPLAKPYAGEFTRFAPQEGRTSGAITPPAERIRAGRGVFDWGELQGCQRNPRH